MSRELFQQGFQIFIAVMLAVMTVATIYSRRKRQDLEVAIPGKAFTILFLVQLPLVGALFMVWLASDRQASLPVLNLMQVLFSGIMAWYERYRPVNGLSHEGVLSYGMLTPWSSIRSYEFVENVLKMRLPHMRARMRIPTNDLPIAKQLLASVGERTASSRPVTTSTVS